MAHVRRFNAAFVITLTGKVIRIDNLGSPPFRESPEFSVADLIGA